MKRFLLILILCARPCVAAADAPAAVPAVKAEAPKLVVGQEVVRLGDAAGSTAKSLIYVLALLLAGFGAWKHFQQKKGSSPSAMRIVGRTSVGPRAALVLAEVEGRRFLLSQTPDRLTLISELPKDSESNFHQLLSEEIEAHDGESPAKASNDS